MPKVTKPPPSAWVQARQAEGLGEKEWMRRWRAMPKNEQVNATGRARNLEAARARAAAGATDVRTLNIVRRGGYRMHTSEQEARAAHLEAQKDSRQRISEQWMEFREKYATGCSIDGCVVGADLGCLLSHVQLDDSGEKSNLSELRGEKLEHAGEKTVCLCLWHHFVRLRQQRGDRKVVDIYALNRRRLAQMKLEVGCQHPIHKDMPYGRLLPSTSADARMHGFFDISHTKLGEHDPNKRLKSSLQVQHLENGVAAVHCRFCHRLYTMCEYAKLYYTPACQKQFARLKELHPAFVQDFEQKTADFDWKREAERLGAVKTIAQKVRGRNKKKRAKEAKH